MTIIDNLLFGRLVAKDTVAERRVMELVEAVLIELDIKRDIMLLLADSQVGISGARLPIDAKHRIPLGV